MTTLRIIRHVMSSRPWTIPRAVVSVFCPAGLEVVVFACALIQDERPVVGGGVPLQGRNLSDRGNFRSFRHGLLVQDLFSEPHHSVTGFTRIPKDAFRHGPVIEILACLVGRSRSDHGGALDMLFPHSLSRSRSTLATESQETA